MTATAGNFQILDATALLDAIVGPLLCEGLVGYDLSDVRQLWRGNAQVWHQRFIRADFAALQIELAANLLSLSAPQRVICNIGHAEFALSQSKFLQLQASVKAHFNVEVIGTFCKHPVSCRPPRQCQTLADIFELAVLRARLLSSAMGALGLTPARTILARLSAANWRLGWRQRCRRRNSATFPSGKSRDQKLFTAAFRISPTSAFATL